MFQFYDSPIKSHLVFQEAGVNLSFQFYDSPIKSNIFQIVVFFYFSFNSMIVRLKVFMQIAYGIT